MNELKSQNTMTTIYAGNLSYKRKHLGVRTLFEEFGKVKDVEIIFDKKTGKHQGLAFVKMHSAAEARVAIETLDGQVIDGRTIKVSVAQNRYANVEVRQVTKKAVEEKKAIAPRVTKKQKLQKTGLNLLFANRK